MDKDLILSVMAATLYRGWGDKETLLSFERSVILPIIHNRYYLQVDEATNQWDWFISYVYLDEDRHHDIINGLDILTDADYENSHGDYIYTPFTINASNASARGIKSVVKNLGSAGCCKYISRNTPERGLKRATKHIVKL